MSQTGKLGIGDSRLANVQLAFVTDGPTPPAITTQDGRLGGRLGDTILALAGVDGPLTFNLSAESVLVLAQTADPHPTIAAHPSPDWVLGGPDSQPGTLLPGFDGEPAARPNPTTQTGLLAAALGDTVLGLDGIAGPQVFNLSASSPLAIAQTADPSPVFVAHVSPRWVLGGQDSFLGGEQLAFAGTDEPRPATGDLTGKLGTAASLLGGVRLALGLAEGGGGATIVYGTALSALDLSSDAAAGVVRSRVASDALTLTDAAGVGAVRGVDAASELSVRDTAASAALREVAASDALDLTGVALSAAVFLVVADSAAELTATADAPAVRTLAAVDALPLTDEAARTALLALGAESAVELATAADVAAVRAVAAVSTLDLTDEAGNTGRSVWTLGVESAVSLTDEVGIQIALSVGGAVALGLMDAASSAAVRSLTASSAVSLASAAAAAIIRPATASSALALTDAAAGHKTVVCAIESAIGLGQAADVAVVRSASVESALAITDAAAGGVWVSAEVDAWDWLPIWDWAEVAVVRGVAAQNTLALVQAEQTARPWYVAADTAVQTTSLEYDPQLDQMVERLEGLQDAANTARPLTAAVVQAVPLGQSASMVLVKPTAINVSAESVLELLGEIRPNQVGDAGHWLILQQAATADKCKLVRSTLDLAAEAAAAHSGPRGAASALSLHQAATYYLVSAGILQRYHPFIGAGAPGAPTPPPVELEGPRPGVTASFQLVYPASGPVTDSLTLRAPNLGNKDRLGFNRVLRETRGGTLVVFADPMWPKIQTLVLNFSGLSAAQSQQLLAFLETHLGEEVGVYDWERRYWTGVITTPTDPVVQDGKDRFSASFEFEGELVPA